MLLSVVLILSMLALVFDVVLAQARGVPVDPVSVPIFGTLAGACITALGAFWASDSKPRERSDPPDDPGGRSHVIPTGDEESDQWNRDHGYLELRKGARWKPCWLS